MIFKYSSTLALKASICFIFCLCLSSGLWAQESKLAQQYYSNGEYEKSAALYKKLSDKNKNNDFYFGRFVESLLNLEDYSNAEEAIKKQIKSQPKKVQLYVTYGKLFESQFMDDKAKEQYEKAIKKLPADRFIISKLANAFIRLTKYQEAMQTYEKGAELLKDENIFAYDLGDLYRRKGDNPLMIKYYLKSIENNPSKLPNLKTMMQRYLVSEEDYDELQTQLYDRIQEDDSVVEYPELLTWLFIQRKDYKNALRQVKALDARLNENGNRIFNLANIAANAKDYDSAIQAYDYLVESKGERSTYYIDSKRESLTCKRKQLVAGFDYTEEDLRALELQYQGFLEEFGKTKSTASIIVELADLEAFYLNDLDKAISLLKELIEYPGINKGTLARAKISLADFYLMKGERWEATLLYSQVDKDFKDDQLGHEARFRNAKLSYYMSDFQWAQAQFNVLKASTSKLISNDAIDLSVFITDNLGLDTTTASIQLYAEADLLTFQNRFDEAFLKLDTLRRDYADHALVDDVLYAEAKIYTKLRDYVKAEEKYNRIIRDHKEEIRADNAMFELAELYENQLNDLEKAKALYEQLFIEMSGSTYAVEARKRYRRLRGDEI